MITSIIYQFSNSNSNELEPHPLAGCTWVFNILSRVGANMDGYANFAPLVTLSVALGFAVQYCKFLFTVLILQSPTYCTKQKSVSWEGALQLIFQDSSSLNSSGSISISKQIQHNAESVVQKLLVTFMAFFKI